MARFLAGRASAVVGCGGRVPHRRDDGTGRALRRAPSSSRARRGKMRTNAVSVLLVVALGMVAPASGAQAQSASEDIPESVPAESGPPNEARDDVDDATDAT